MTQVWTKEQVLAATRKYFDGDELASDVFLKYCLGNNGEYYELTPDDMHKRLAKEFARIEAKYPNPLSEEEIYSYLKGFKYIVPQGSPMSAVGNNYQIQTVGNCYVVKPPNDSYGSIHRVDEEITQISKRRGGVGTDISNIRPKGMATKNAAKTTDGIGVFMERFSNSIREVGQHGRRGALMLTINCHHPEIETFINIKRDLRKVTGANISVRWTDEFLEAVEKDQDVELRFPVDPALPRKFSKWVSAKKIWEQFRDCAWECAEPGCQFIDTIWRMGPSDMYPGWKSESSNPCGEQHMNDDSCRLMLLNLYSFVKNRFLKNAEFDVVLFDKIVQIAQRLMDDLVDLELEKIDLILAKIASDPEPTWEKECETRMWNNFKANCIAGRRTGLGITGLADAIAALGARFGSERSLHITEDIYRRLALAAYASSIQLAKERGCFPICDIDKELEHPFLDRIITNLPLQTQADYKRYGRRNIALTTTAPAGSVSFETQTASGIEPVIFLSYKKRRKVNKDSEKIDHVDESGDCWQEYDVFHKPFLDWQKATGLVNVEDSPYFKSTANEIDWESSVEQQALAQKWVCNAISRTVNLPKDVSKEEVHKIYWKAWKSGCKGITIYREGSRDAVMFQGDGKKQKGIFIPTEALKRPEIVDCEIHRPTIQGEKWVCLVGLVDGRPYEVFTGLSDKIVIPRKYEHGKIVKNPRKTDRSIYDLVLGDEDDPIIIKDLIKVFDNPNHAMITRLISLALRHGSGIKYVVEQLLKDETDDFTSFSKVVARTLKKYIKDGEKVTSDKVCPACGSDKLAYQSGCVSCTSCDWQKCG